jgi:predicted DNA-binding transcriptional regulator YafY
MDVHARKEYIYLRAHCHLRDAERHFRLDRVVEMKVEE